MMYFSTLVKHVLNISIFFYFWANKIKNILKLNLNSLKKNKNILKTSEAENGYFFKNAQSGLEKCGSYKKRVYCKRKAGARGRDQWERARAQARG